MDHAGGRGPSELAILPDRLCVISFVRHLEAAAGAPALKASERFRNRSRRRDGRRLRRGRALWLHGIFGVVRRYSSAIVTLLSISPCLIAFTTSWPLRTWPKTVCFPSSQSVTTWVMKNWLPLVFGPAFAIDSVPIWCLFGLPLVSSSKR